MKYKPTFFILLVFAIIPLWSRAEGTRELQPQSSETLYLYPSKDVNGYGSFATSVADEKHKLWVTIKEVGEKILFGFKPNSSSTGISVTIVHSSGSVLFPSTVIPSSGAGYIATWDEAVAGPNTINLDGYSPFQASPTQPGDYYIQFDWSGGATTKEITFFDITVVNASNVEQRGRLWSKNWQFYGPYIGNPPSNAHYSNFNGLMYPYTDDQITTQIDFNGMAPARFTVSCNSTGCDNTGNFVNDRKSRTGNYTYPAYKIFINNPDESLYPTGIVGGVDSVHLENPCNGEVDISVYVNKPGMADILLDINPLPGVQAEDIRLSDSVLDGNATTIVWDGLNGLGELVPNGSTFNITVTYINGLTHLPLYDVEYSEDGNNKWSGFIVNLIRPAGDKPSVFWDDRNLTGGGYNLDGCTDPSGCHYWGLSTGNDNSVNTWWFAVSTTLVPITIQYRRSETIPYNYILCEGDSVNVFGNWVSQPCVFRDTLTNFMGCDSISEVTVTVKPGPAIELGPDQLLCQGESTTLGSVVPNVLSYVWNTVPPQATPLATTPTLTVNSTATYQVQITASNGCIRTDQVHVTAAAMINQSPIRHN